MIVEFQMKELERTLKEEFEIFGYVDVEVRRAVGRVYAVVSPPKAFEMIISPRTIGDLKVFEREDEGRCGVYLRDLIDFLEKVVDCGNEMDKKCANLIEALKKLCEEGDEDG